MSRKNPNVKEFVKYLDYTVKVFDKHVAEEDFEKKDSDVYKLFGTLFHMYDNISNDQADIPRTRRIPMQSYNSTETESNYPKWENQSTQYVYKKREISSDDITQQRKKKTTSSDGSTPPRKYRKNIELTDDETDHSIWEPVTKQHKKQPKDYLSDSETSIPGISIDVNRRKYMNEHSEEINNKILEIKKMLDKNKKIDK